MNQVLRLTYLAPQKTRATLGYTHEVRMRSIVDHTGRTQEYVAALLCVSPLFHH